MNTPNVPVSAVADARSESAEDELRRELASLRGELERRSVSSRATAQFYLEGLARSFEPETMFRSMADMLCSMANGLGLADEDSGTWLVIFENPLELSPGTIFGEPDQQVLNHAEQLLDRDPMPALLPDSTGKDFIAVALPGRVPSDPILGVFAIAARPGIPIPEELKAIILTIATLTTLHLDRVSRITVSNRNTQYAQAAARAQLELTEPREREQALSVALETLRSVEDLSGAMAVDATGDKPVAIASFGEMSEEMALAAISGSGGPPPGMSVLPVKVAGKVEAYLVLKTKSEINAIEDEILGSITTAVVGAIVRFRGTETIESLRRSATRRLVEAQERERSMVAADIHDGVLQQLGATAIRLELAQARVEQSDFATASSIIEDGAKEIRSCARELRALLMELRPQVLDDNGLNSALNELGRQVDHVDVNVETDVPDDLGNEYSITIFRIVQEALTNIQKHAKATSASVKVGIVDDSVLIEIRDNGIGYEGAVAGPSSEGSHLGLLGMRERARMLDGEFAISGRSGSGTVITCRLPLGAAGDPAIDPFINSDTPI
ncbi:MAG: sensor histidine kinase [Solirubrobacterales bacterium]